MKKTKTQADRPYRERLGFAGGLQELWKHKLLYLMTLPTIIWVLIFCYYPMYGVLIAFKDFNYKDGIWGSPWVGLKNFQFLFNYKGVGKIFFNTIFLNVLFIATGTVMSIILALVFVEIKKKVYNKVVQTIAIFPHFVSWTVVSMFMSGIIGGGGLGKIAINYGYYRYKYLVMFLAVVLLILLVQVFQSAGTRLAAKSDKRLK